MAAVIRIFYHQGLVSAPMANGMGRNSSEGLQMLHQPYIGRDFVCCALDEAVSTDGSNAVPGSHLVRVEVQPGKAVYYEVNPPGRNFKVTDCSPMFSGNITLPFGAGWTMSFLEADLS